VAVLARYGGQTLDPYHADLRQYFQWVGETGLAASPVQLDVSVARRE